jgi:acetylornithine deacetylase/succinyl-diaminopimelate desuccinylase-like protein
MYGRGVTDDKDPVLGWLNVIREYQAIKNPLAVCLVFCLEGLEEVGSAGLQAVLEAEIKNEGSYLDAIDSVCISDNYWLGTTKPCLTCGLRGTFYFTVEIKTAGGKDKHSGYAGRT